MDFRTELVFGWELKSKQRIKNVAFNKANEYTLVRDRNENEVTQTHKDVEARWDKLFDKWNKFDYIYFIILFLISIIIFAIWCFCSFSLMDACVYVCVYSCTIFFAGGIVTVFSMVLKKKKKNNLDKISKEIRQVNLIRKAKKNPFLSLLRVEIENENISDEQLNSLKAKISKALLEDNLLKLCDEQKNEQPYKIHLSKNDFKIHIVLPIGKNIDCRYIKILKPIGDEYWINDNKVDAKINGDVRLIPIDENSELLKISWQISYSEDGHLKKYNLLIKLPISFDIE